MFEKSTKQYDALKKRYLEYVDLYIFLNNGSSEGITNFAEFYWRFTYNVKYEDPTTISEGNV